MLVSCVILLIKHACSLLTNRYSFTSCKYNVNTPVSIGTNMPVCCLQRDFRSCEYNGQICTVYITSGVG